MPTPYRGYTEIPGAVTPDVPYRVNLALREIDADVQDLERATKESDLRLAGRVASLEGSKGGEPLKVEDERAAALLADPNSRTSGQLRTVLGDHVPGIAADAAASEPLRSAIRSAADERFPGPLSRWGAALAASSKAPAIWVNLGSSTAEGASSTNPALSWAARAIGYLSSRTRTGTDAVTARPTAAGVYMFSGAVGGSTSATYLTTARMAKVKLLAPQLITHMVGANDYANGVDLTTYKTNLRNWVNQCATQVPGAVQVLIHQQARIDMTTPKHPWEEYGKVMAEVAAEYENVLFLDVDARFRELGLSPEGDRAGLMADLVHMGNRGHKILADVIMDFLGTPIHPHPTEVLRGAVTGGTFAAGVESVPVEIAVPPAPVPRRATFAVTVNASSPGESEFLLYGYSGTTGTDLLPEGDHLILRISNTKLTAVSGAASWLIPANTAARLVMRQNGNKYISPNVNYNRAEAQLTAC